MRKLSLNLSEIPRSTKILVVVLVSLGSMAGVLIVWSFFVTGNTQGLLLNVGTEILGAVVIYILIRIFIERTQARDKLKKQLIADFGSPVNDVAKAAAYYLDHEGWLKDGSIKGGFFDGTDLSKANLRGADLRDAHLDKGNLRGADLRETDLRDAYLIHADLSGAKLMHADLSGAHLCGANLSEADLNGAKLIHADLRAADLNEAKVIYANLERVILEKADLIGANLEGANLIDAKLIGANLEGANLIDAKLIGANFHWLNLEKKGGKMLEPIGLYVGDAKFNDRTTLPDGTMWTPDTDMKQFTEPNPERDGQSNK